MPRPGNRRFKSRDRGPRRNDRIRAPEIRVIGPNGKNLGVLETKTALKLAQDGGLDLIEISPPARPPVCRILDYGKYLYEESKKKKDNKKSGTSKLKEVKIRLGIDAHDLDTQIRRAERCLYEGNKVKFTLTFRGRENEHRDLGFGRMENVVAQLEHVGTMDADPKFAGRNLGMLMSPLPKERRMLKLGSLDDEVLDDDDDEEELDEDLSEDEK